MINHSSRSPSLGSQPLKLQPVLFMHIAAHKHQHKNTHSINQSMRVHSAGPTTVQPSGEHPTDYAAAERANALY